MSPTCHTIGVKIYLLIQIKPWMDGWLGRWMDGWSVLEGSVFKYILPFIVCVSLSNIQASYRVTALTILTMQVPFCKPAF